VILIAAPMMSSAKSARGRSLAGQGVNAHRQAGQFRIATAVISLRSAATTPSHQRGAREIKTVVDRVAECEGDAEGALDQRLGQMQSLKYRGSAAQITEAWESVTSPRRVFFQIPWATSAMRSVA
jgi:hypothetical protein